MSCLANRLPLVVSPFASGQASASSRFPMTTGRPVICCPKPFRPCLWPKVRMVTTIDFRGRFSEILQPNRLRKGLYRTKPLLYSAAICGEVTERPKVHDWKSCVPQGTEGSNPSLSASFKLAVSDSWRNSKRNECWRETPSAVFPVLFDTIEDFADRSDSRVPRNGRSPIPSGPGGSSGNGLSRVPRGRLAVTCVGNPFFARRPYRRVYGDF